MTNQSKTAPETGYFVDERDGKKYRTVKIGRQTWMAENLAYNAEGSRTYEDKPENEKKYGRLYDWETAMQAVPEGWHVPSDYEWIELIKEAGGELGAGQRLKARKGWSKPFLEGGCGTNKHGFLARPGGYFDSESKSFGGIGDKAVWWVDGEVYSDDYYEDNVLLNLAPARLIANSSAFREELEFAKTDLLSVRCVKD